MSDCSSITISMSGTSLNSNIILYSNSSTLTHNASDTDLSSVNASLETNTINIASNAANISSNAVDISKNAAAIDVNAVSIGTVESSLKTNNDSLLVKSMMMQSFFRYYSELVDLSAGIITSTKVYPPDLNNYSGNESNISLKQVTPGGIASNEISKEDYFKYDTYASGNLNPNLLNLEGINDLDIPFIYGYNELFANDPSNINGFNPTAGAPYIFSLGPGMPIMEFSLDMINAMGSQSNCNGQQISNAMFLHDISRPEVESYGFYIPPYKLDNKDFSYILLNDDGEYAPASIGPSFEKIDSNNKTWADRLITWCGLSGEDNLELDDVSFTKLSTNPSMVAKMKYIFMMAKVYKMEKLQQYGIIKLDADYVCELITRAKGDMADLSYSGGLKNNQCPDWNYGMNVWKELVEALVNVDPSLNAGNILGVLVPPFPPIVAPPGGGNPVGLFMRIFLFHIASMLAMCHNNVVDPSYIEPMKNLSHYWWDGSGIIHDVSCGLDLTNNTQLPSILVNVPIFQELWFKLGKTYVLNNGIHLGGSRVRLRDTIVGQSLINMYAKIYNNIVENNTPGNTVPLLSVEKFYSTTYFTEFITQILENGTCYRTRNPTFMGAFGAPVLTSEQMTYLAKTTNAINFKLLEQLSILAPDLSGSYSFLGTFGSPMNHIPDAGVGGTLSDFEAAALTNPELSLPPITTCPCLA